MMYAMEWNVDDAEWNEWNAPTNQEQVEFFIGATVVVGNVSVYLGGLVAAHGSYLILF